MTQVLSIYVHIFISYKIIQCITLLGIIIFFQEAAWSGEEAGF